MPLRSEGSDRSSGILLAFYRNNESAVEAIGALRRAHFVKSAVLQRDANGKVSAKDNEVMPREAIILGIAVGLLLAVAFYLAAVPFQDAFAPGNPQLGALLANLMSPAFLALFPIIGAASGFVIAKILDFGVENRMLARYGRWVTREETLVVIQSNTKLARAHEILRTTGNQGPTVFVERSGRVHRADRSAEPERLELLAGERLQMRAKRLAEQQRISKITASARSHTALLTRLRDTQRTVEVVEASLGKAASLDQSVSISAEWLLDNAYIVQSQIKDVRQNLTTGFYRELPVLDEGKDAGTPRIYTLAADLIANTDARIDRENMTGYLQAYQEIEPLKLSELWAMPLMLRMALIEKLRFLTIRIDERQGERERADFWANRLLAAAHRDADQLVSLLNDLVKEHPNVTRHFADRLVAQLYDEEAALSGVRSWLERKLDQPLAEIVQAEGRRQAADQVAIANIITSLRQLLELDWRDIFEEISLVHQTLSYDPAKVYLLTDFATRDRYRHAIEGAARKRRPAKGSPGDGHAEIETARAAINLAVAAPENGGDHLKHVGYYLIDDGQADLYKRLEVALPRPLARQRWIYQYAAAIYIGGIGALTLSISALAAAEAREHGASFVTIGCGFILGVFAISELSSQLWDYILTRLLPPRPLPKMNFRDGIADGWETLVIVPMMLTSLDEIVEDTERLEVRSIANPDPQFKFALLADFTDALEPHTPDDETLLNAAITGIQRLNERHGDRFFLFHRQRQWCASEGKWIGWERKRGKLEELNHFLCTGAPDENTLLRVGAASELRDIAFVITLDADTQLPHDSARRLVETLAHPLNRPYLSADAKRVERGYTIIQPRVSTELPSAISTRFTRLFTDARGNDPYTHLVSHVYQDLTGEGAYHGKGIYDLRAFTKVLENRFPTDTLLSHDLIEGSFVRVGLATDIELFDQFPSNYLTFAKRDHRWIRGDWQIAPWLKKNVPTHDGGTEPNVLSPINKWKIFDNLRRSLVPIFTLAFLIGAWLVVPAMAEIASVLVAGLYFLPPVLGFFSWISGRPWKHPFPARDLRNAVGRSLLNIALLPQRASLSIDAVARVLYRRFVSHKNLLEWTTASAASRGAGNQQARFFRRLLWSSVLAIAVGAGVWWLNNMQLQIVEFLRVKAADTGIAVTAPLSLWISTLPFLLLWFITPFWVYWLSGGKLKSRAAALGGADKLYLRRVARETWRYFDDFIGPQTNWLPPDNYQEYLNIELAPRTSPTNIGLWLLSALAARDFGFLTPDQAIERTAATTETLVGMERYEGHFLNWYDIFSALPLNPRYVSAVDSGNLLVSFWAFNNGVRDVTREPVVGPAALHGLADTLAVLKEKTDVLSPNAQGKIATLERLFADPPQRLDAILTRLRTAGEPAFELTRIMRETTQAATALDPGIYWAEALERQVAAWNSIIDRYLVWAFHLMEQSEDSLRPLGEAAIAARRSALIEAPSLEQLARGEIAAITNLAALRAGGGAVPDALAGWLDRFAEESSRARWLAGEMLAQSEVLVERIDTLGDEMKLGWLYDQKRKLFHIGFNVTDRRLDNSYYDLIASECRLTSFAAIARGEVPAEHWIKLRRLYVNNGTGSPALMSWSGTMFEYLMPLLYTHQYENSLLDYGCRAAVVAHQEYGRKRGIPWGISEAAFSALDAGKTYQYQAFGVPGLGLKRGLEDDLVVAPYASCLAVQVDPLAAIENLKRLEKIGMRGAYGFYESIDYTRQRVPEGERGVIVRNFMVHHHGMSLLAFSNVLHDAVVRRRFHADPRTQAASPLLYESVPTAPPILEATARERRTEKLEPLEAATSVESFGTPDTPTPRVNLLSNGNYSLMLTNAGGGYSRWREFDITRWRGDTTADDWGQWIYIRDLDDRSTWSVAYQPTIRPDRRYNATFSPDKANFRRRDNEIESFTEIIVSPEDDVEIRRVTLINHSKRARRIELTSYAELSLAPHAADRAHPAFAKLFIQTQAVPEQNALVAWRRPRSPKDAQIWAGHALVADKARLDFETDRARFIGRGRTDANPKALDGELSKTDGAVLDPVFSLRHRVRLAPGERLEVHFLTAAGDSRERVLETLGKYSDGNAIARAFELSWTNSQLEMHRLRIAPEDVSYFQQLAGHMLYPAAQLRAPARRIRENRKQQRALWAYGISGDLPILLVSISHARDVRAVKQLLQAHTFWAVRGLKCDLIILDEDAASYEQTLSDELKRLVQSNTQYTGIDVPGGVFLRGAGALPEDDLTLLQTLARVSLLAARGTLAQQLGAISTAIKLPPRLVSAKRLGEEPSAPLSFMELPYFNGLGGFTEDGREYAIYLGPNTVTPAPWCNVMANENFGLLISESGPGYCWCGNSQMNRLTPWSNDPVTDPANDAIYIRDEETGTYWTPTPLPIRENDAYRTRHGQGYSVFEHNSHAIEQQLTVYVPCDDDGGAPVRVQRLRLRNGGSRPRKLSVTSFNALTLGTTNEETVTNIFTSWDENDRVLLARNPYHPAFGHKVAFFTMSPTPAYYSGDRNEFLGRNGIAAKPAAMGRMGLSNRVGAALDPCASMQSTIDLPVRGEVEIIIITGQADSEAEALRLAKEWREADRADVGLATTRGYWDTILDALHVETPDKAVNFLLNRWLVYQDLACRIWGRSAFYQSGGAFGFRDQLQDTMAMVYARPSETRAQIIRASQHQFLEGDVQHWWHPPTGAGVRTKFSDDLLWLPLVTAHYLRTTGDASVLHEETSFLEAPVLKEDEHETYIEPQTSDQRASILEHCRRSIHKGLTSGPHGLPLIGIGDWNDGMSRVGVAGKGESVWLAWFLIVVLRDFAELLKASTDKPSPELLTEMAWCETEAQKLAATVEREAWDGEWYIRAYFDNGEPLGSHRSDEANIDSLPQSWAILSGAGRHDRAEQGMAAVEKYLVKNEDEMILLFTPPFDKSAQDPGYIKGYVPGVRENGGQYTHAAIWVAQATARKGDGKRAVELMRLLNPVEHARTPGDVAKYQVEPYVITADVYALEGRVGRGGWSWYTGSASWFYRVWIEEILGFHLRGESLHMVPHIPEDWKEFTIRYRHKEARYDIRVENAGGALTAIEVDGQSVPPEKGIPLEEHGHHKVLVKLG